MDANKMVKMKWQFLLVSGIFSVVTLIICSFFFKAKVVYALAVGLLFAIFDNCLMILDIEKGSKTTFEKALVVMKKSMFKRIAFLSISFIVAIKAGIYMLALFIAFFLVHVVCLVFFIINAWGKDIPLECRKE